MPFIFSLDTYVCVMTYMQYVNKIHTEIRIPCRRPTLVATAVRQPVARCPRLSQFSPQSLHPSELPRVSFWGEASQLCSLWPPARTPLFPVPARGIGSPSSALVGQRACSAGLLYQAPSRNLKALKLERDQASKKKRRTEGAQDCAAADQFRRLGVGSAAADPSEMPCCSICDFLDDHEEMIEAVRHDLKRAGFRMVHEGFSESEYLATPKAEQE